LDILIDVMVQNCGTNSNMIVSCDCDRKSFNYLIRIERTHNCNISLLPW